MSHCDHVFLPRLHRSSNLPMVPDNIWQVVNLHTCMELGGLAQRLSIIDSSEDRGSHLEHVQQALVLTSCACTTSISQTSRVVHNQSSTQSEEIEI